MTYIKSVFQNTNLIFFSSNLLSHHDEKISLYSSSVMFGVLRNSATTREEIVAYKWKDLAAGLIFSSHKGVLYS